MANVLQELMNVCRFCLCENKQHLKPILQTLDSTLTTDEIARYTGLMVNTDEDCTLYAMCLECTSKLRKSIEFRRACLNNQKHFEELLMMLVASAESTSYESADSENSMDSSDDMMEQALVDLLQEEDSNIKLIHSPDPSQPSEVCEEDDDMYCANYIEPATSYHSDSDDLWEIPIIELEKTPRKKNSWKKDAPPEPSAKGRKRRNKTYETPPPFDSEYYYVKTYKDGKRICMKSLCEICGKLVVSIATHIENHLPDTTHSCPHCPVKMKTKNNITQHIKTVHDKIVGKTCNICGKGFIHHKTYRYHMLSHQSEGKVFECKLCCKTFDKSFGLRDHHNRVHNIARALKQTD